MIFVDSRTGSKELKPYFTVDNLLVSLDYGDVTFTGNGPEGEVTIGIERKRIGDLLGSIESGRLSGHQLPGLLETYDVVYLFVEGITKADKTDDSLWVSTTGGATFKKASHGNRKWTAGAVDHYLTTLETRLGVHLRHTVSPKHTAKRIEYLYEYWQKPWERHNSHLALHKGKDFRIKEDKKVVFMPDSMLEKPSLVRKISAELPGVGVRRSMDVHKAFTLPTDGKDEWRAVDRMWRASIEEWGKVEGFGKVSSRQAWEALHGKESKA